MADDFEDLAAAVEVVGPARSPGHAEMSSKKAFKKTQSVEAVAVSVPPLSAAGSDAAAKTRDPARLHELPRLEL